MPGSVITGTGSYVPSRVLSNGEIATRLGITEDWIVEKTGIRERRVAAPDEATSDLATKAAEQALASAGLVPDDIDLIILATSTPDQPMPATACLVQANLGASRATAMDVNAVCTGFIYGFSVARSMLLADPGIRNALVIGADTYSRILNYDDRSTAVLFGDGAGAVVITKTDTDSDVIASFLGSDGTKADYIQIPGGGSRRPASCETVSTGDHYFAMRGRETRMTVAENLPRLTDRIMELGGFGWTDVDHVVPHQANGVMLSAWSDAVGLRPGVLRKTVERYGNTGAASVPLTLDDTVRQGMISPGDLVMLFAVGGGVTWGGLAVRWAGVTLLADRDAVTRAVVGTEVLA
ncbi:ketoacyl-ACP synthase III [Nocardia sp. NPDC046473]|uniref:3-oxoacyl-ACP synthase III family protein n=1 Tax=Nocardia sp. NPDC046473 TaxID=3155733 RepID=UPI0033D84C15